MRVRICDFPTGRRILDVPFLQASWTSEFNGAEDVSCTVDVNDRRIRRLGLANAASVAKSCLIIEDGNLCVGGPIWNVAYDRDGGTVQITGKGLWSYFDHRVLLPVMQASDRLTNADGSANTAFDTNIVNTSYENIVKRWVMQANAWMPEASRIPIAYGDDVPGVFQRNIKGAETKLIGDLMSDITGVQQGVDIRFQPRRTADGLGYEWLMSCGHPRLTSDSVKRWDMSVPKSPITGLKVEVDGSDMASQVWETGGASSDTAIIERVVDAGMDAKGYPMLERVESLSTTVVDAATAIRHANETIRTSTQPRQSWSFDVRRDATLGSDWDAGYPCSIRTKHDPFIPDGWHDLRIMTLAGSSSDDKITVKTGAVYG
jgi:hypothetical protein